jgi:hypothetical protein
MSDENETIKKTDIFTENYNKTIEEFYEGKEE